MYARAGRRAEAGETARELLRRLPASAPQRLEVERLLAALRQRIQPIGFRSIRVDTSG